MNARLDEITASLPGRDCGECGFPTCAGLAEMVARSPLARRRCVHLGVPISLMRPGEAQAPPEQWLDLLGREYQMVLEPFAHDPGPREQVLPFNPLLAERLALKAGDIVFGRPAGVGCPVLHVGRLMAPPDARSGELTWCVVGPAVSRGAESIEIGDYHIVAYEGLVRLTRVTPQVGGRFFFKPAYCMLQARHSGVLSFAAQTAAGWRVRFEGIAIA
jgi:uncharacterized Fe-S cluster-containing protein